MQGSLLDVSGSLGGRGVWGRMDTCVCMAESIHCSPETVTSLLIDSNIKNKKLEKDISGDGAPKRVFLASWLDCDACISEVKGLLFLMNQKGDLLM